MNDPVNFIDPSGKIPIVVAAPIAGAVVGGAVAGTITAVNGGSAQDIIKSVTLGASGGAVAGLGLATTLGAALSTSLGIGTSTFLGIDDLGGFSTDFFNGIIKRGKSPSVKVCEGIR